MSRERKKPADEFVTQLYAFLWESRFAGNYSQASGDAHAALLDAEQEITRQAREPGFNHITASARARKIRERYEKAEKKAREAAAIAKKAKETAAAVEHLASVQYSFGEHLKEVKIERAREEARLAKNEDEQNRKNGHTEAARRGGAAQGDGDQGTSEAA